MPVPSVDLPVPTGAAAPEEAALVVGIEDYFVLPDVPHARRDAEAFAGFLEHTRGIPADRIRRLDRASREQILAALDDPALAGAGTVWVYFAGHGAASPSTGARLLLGADAQPDLAAFESRAVSVAELTARLGPRGLLVLDTCYTGFGRAGEAVLGKRFAVPTWAEPEAAALTWTAAAPDEWSGVLPGADHGAFTWAVLGALRGWADVDADGAVTAGEAQQWVAAALPAVGVPDQHPQLLGAPDRVLSTATEPAPPLTVGAAPPDDRPDGPAAPTEGRLGVVHGAAEPAALQQHLLAELDRRVDRGWAAQDVRFAADGTGFGVGATASVQAWVVCADGVSHEVLAPPSGGTGTWRWHARRLSARIEREAPCPAPTRAAASSGR